jgi:hypothetical protein
VLEQSNPWPSAPSGAADWLRDRCGDGLTGFMPPAMPDAAWVLNALYEHERGPGDTSYHEYRQARIAEGRVRPHVLGGVDLEAGSVATGGGLGRAEHPGSGWRRLRWAELARRTGDPVIPDGLLPSHRCFPSATKEGSWPLGIVPPAEGSLDRETWTRLIDVLIEHSPAGPDTPCLAYCSPLGSAGGGSGGDDRPVRTPQHQQPRGLAGHPVASAKRRGASGCPAVMAPPGPGSCSAAVCGRTAAPRPRPVATRSRDCR